MIPAGPERDRLICWTKLKEIPINKRRPRCTKCEPDCDIFNLFSTDIATAMELMPDLINSSHTMTVQMAHTGDNTSVVIIRHTQIIMTSNDIDAPKAIAAAISGAWLNWKGDRK